MTAQTFDHAVRRHADGQTVTAVVSGEWDGFSDDSLITELQNALEEGYRYIVVDGTQLSFCDSTRLGALVGLHKLTQERNGWLRIVAPNYAVRRPMTLTGLDQVLDVYDSRSDLGDAPT
jgi:anti-sigma B factor antagonist